MSRLKPSVRNGGLPKSALRQLPAPQEVLPEGDPRMHVLANAVVPYERREDFVREIASLWQRAQATFLTIGKYLAAAKERLPYGEFNAMIERDLPFGPTTAFQIRAAAEAVESGRLPMAHLPSNYSTLYVLSTLPPDALEKAKKCGLLRPDLRRAEVVAFKRKLVTTMDEVLDPVEAKARRLAELRQQQEAIAAEIARLENEPE